MARQAQALYDFESQSSEELPLVADEILIITNQDVGGGWWEAKNQYGRVGLIPQDYVELLPDDSLPEPSMPPPPLPGLPAANPESVQPSSAPPPLDQHQSAWDNQPQPSAPRHQPAAPASAPPAGGYDEDWDDDWSDDDGSSVTTEQSYQQQWSPTQSNIGSNAIRHGGQSSRSTRPDSVKGGKTISRLSNHNKLGFDAQLLSKEAQNVPENEKLRIVETQRGWEWEPLTGHDCFTCLVDSPKKSSKLKGLKSFIVYQLTPSFSGIAVERRYKHFDWLHERFVEKFPTIVVPPLPDKQLSGRYEDDFINERMKQLQEWVTRITNHPVVSKSNVWRHFLTCTDEKTWKRGKREAENDKFRGGKFFHTIVTPPAPLDQTKVDKDIDNFAMFVRKMDDGIKTFSAVVSDQMKRYPTNFKKEYQKVSDAVSQLKTAFDSDGCSNSQPLNQALAETSAAYGDIATMFQQQPRQDWLPLADNLHLYKGILSCFDGTLATQKIASAKIKESQKLHEEGKMMEGEVQAIAAHAEAISYSLYAEINHFQANRQQEFKIWMQNFLSEQIDFYRRITERLEAARRNYDSF